MGQFSENGGERGGRGTGHAYVCNDYVLTTHAGGRWITHDISYLY